MNPYLLILTFLFFAGLLIALVRPKRKQNLEYTTVHCLKCGEPFRVYPFPEYWQCPHCDHRE